MRLIAIRPVLFESHNYEPGDELPTHDVGMAEAWAANGTAAWKDPDEDRAQSVKARPATAPAGVSGLAYPSAGPGRDLAGKPPSRKARGIVPEPSTGRRKPHA